MKSHEETKEARHRHKDTSAGIWVVAVCCKLKLYQESHKLAMSTRSGRAYLSSPPGSSAPLPPRSPPVSRASSRANSRASTPVNSRASTPAGSERSGRRSVSRTYSSSTEGGDDGSSVFSLVPDSVAAGSVGSSSRRSRTRNAARTNSRGLEVPIQKALAEVIEDPDIGGGLARVGPQIVRFCTKVVRDNPDKADIFGEANSKERDRVISKIRYWHEGIPREEYKALVLNWGIIPAEYSEPEAVPSQSTKPRSANKARSVTEPPVVVSLPTGINSSNPQDFDQYRSPPTHIDSSDEEAPTPRVLSGNTTMSRSEPLKPHSSRVEVMGGIVTGTSCKHRCLV